MNEEQVAYWNGPAADRWTTQQVILDRALTPYSRAVLDRAGARAGEHVLDIGCGCGETSLALSENVGSDGTVLGVDISGPMLARARERAQNRTNLTFLRGDASVFAFPRKFDLAFSRFGVMFFEDPVVSFRHIHSAAQGGGRLTFVCWRSFEENPWTRIPLEAVGTVVPNTEQRSLDLPGPYAFADRAKVERILSEAGYRSVNLERFDADVVLGVEGLEEAVQFAVTSGPASRLLVSVTPDVLAKAKDAVRRALESAKTPNGYALPGSSWLVTASA